METNDPYAKFPELVRILKNILGGQKSCSDMINGYENVMQSIWGYTARLLGNEGTKAVLVRSLQLTLLREPMLANILVLDNKVDFSNLLGYVAEVGCREPKMSEALIRLSVAFFQTLFELTGNTVTSPLLEHLEEESKVKWYPERRIR